MIQTSSEISKITNALFKFQGECPLLPKDGVANISASRRYQYTKLDTMIDLIKPILQKNGLFFIQPVVNNGHGDYLVTRIYHMSGEWIDSSILLRDDESGTSQEFGSQLTYKKRYALATILGLAADEDDDGHAEKRAEGRPSPVIAKPTPRPVTQRVKPGITEDWDV